MKMKTKIIQQAKQDPDISNFPPFDLSFNTNAELLIRLKEFFDKLETFGYVSRFFSTADNIILRLVEDKFLEKENIAAYYCDDCCDEFDKQIIIAQGDDYKEVTFVVAPRILKWMNLKL